jgi:hypothetical protein
LVEDETVTPDDLDYFLLEKHMVCKEQEVVMDTDRVEFQEVCKKQEDHILHYWLLHIYVEE